MRDVNPLVFRNISIHCSTESEYNNFEDASVVSIGDVLIVGNNVSNSTVERQTISSERARDYLNLLIICVALIFIVVITILSKIYYKEITNL